MLLPLTTLIFTIIALRRAMAERSCQTTEFHRRLAAWVFARFTDVFDSLWARGIMFLVLGGMLFGVAFLYYRQKRQPPPSPPDVVVPTPAAVAGKEG